MIKCNSHDWILIETDLHIECFYSQLFSSSTYWMSIVLNWEYASIMYFATLLFVVPFNFLVVRNSNWLSRTSISIDFQSVWIEWILMIIFPEPSILLAILANWLFWQEYEINIINLCTLISKANKQYTNLFVQIVQYYSVLSHDEKIPDKIYFNH